MKSKNVWLLSVAASNLYSVSLSPWPVSFHKIRPDSGGCSTSSRWGQAGRYPPASSRVHHVCGVAALKRRAAEPPLTASSACAPRLSFRMCSLYTRLRQQHVHVFQGCSVSSGIKRVSATLSAAWELGVSDSKSTLFSTKLMTSVS